LCDDLTVSKMQRPVALVTGVGREAGIGAAIVERLAADGWDIGFTYWQPYDDRMPWGRDTQARDHVLAQLAERGARSCAIEADLAEVTTPQQVFERVTSELGPVQALVLSHAESVDSSLLETTVESFDRHFAVNARASWLLIREFAAQYQGPRGSGRIIALTSDHTVGNLPYGASKGALDRITIAAARELADLGITANALNPGPTDTGWIPPDLAEDFIKRSPLGRLGQPGDCANLVSFLCSRDGGWINGQLLHSNGGF
jgi:3-oxoacyl-[acyl-carrier protein] reductase